MQEGIVRTAHNICTAVASSTERFSRLHSAGGRKSVYQWVIFVVSRLWHKRYTIAVEFQMRHVRIFRILHLVNSSRVLFAGVASHTEKLKLWSRRKSFSQNQEGKGKERSQKVEGEKAKIY
jgi:hypothetical protein